MAKLSIGTGDWVDIRGDINDNFTEVYNVKPFEATGFEALATALGSSQSTAFQVIGDSTSDVDAEWTYLFAEDLADLYPEYSVYFHQYNDPGGIYAGEYDAIDAIQTGTAGVRYMALAGAGGGRIDASEFDGVAEDLDIRIRIDADSWRPAADTVLLSRYGSAGARTFFFSIRSAGSLYFGYTQDGSTLAAEASSSNMAADTSGIMWLRVTVDADAGSSDSDFHFYYSAEQVIDSKSVVTWTELGSVQHAAANITLYNGSGVDDTPIELGLRSGSVGYFSGDIYAVEMYGVIDDVSTPLAPVPIDSFYPIGAGFTMVGAPVLHVINGSKSGADYSYLDYGSVIVDMTPPYGQVATLISISHNENYSIGTSYITAVDEYVTQLKARLPLTDITYVIQNPQKAAADDYREHNIRKIHTIAYARRNNYGFIDVARVFLDADDYETDWMTDDVHPNATGQAAWAAKILEAFQTCKAYVSP